MAQAYRIASKQKEATHHRPVAAEYANWHFRPTVTSTSALQLTGTQQWSVKDQLLASTDAWGHKSTVIFNAQDRATDSYGPAPASCYGTNRIPHGSCPILPAHSSRV